MRALLPRKEREHVGVRLLALCIFVPAARLALLKSVKGLAKFAALANALIFLAIGIVLFSAAAAMRQGQASRQYAVAKPADATLVFWHGRLLLRRCVQHVTGRERFETCGRRLAHPLRGHVCGGGVLCHCRSFLLRGLARRQSGSITAEIASHDHASSLEGGRARRRERVYGRRRDLHVSIQLFPSMELLEASFFFRERKRRRRHLVSTEDGVELRRPSVLRKKTLGYSQ